jgi:hypothetical protein
MQEDWLFSPASSASSSAETIAAAVDRLAQAMAKLQEQMEAQYRVTKALTDKIDKIAHQSDARQQPAAPKSQAEPSGLPPKPTYQSPRRNEVRFQLERNSQVCDPHSHSLVLQQLADLRRLVSESVCGFLQQQAPSTPAAPSSTKQSPHEKRLPYKSPVSMFQGHRVSSPILPTADSSVDLSLLTPLSTPDRKFPDSLPLEVLRRAHPCVMCKGVGHDDEDDHACCCGAWLWMIVAVGD